MAPKNGKGKGKGDKKKKEEKSNTHILSFLLSLQKSSS